jgi:hypothetical protein
LRDAVGAFAADENAHLEFGMNEALQPFVIRAFDQPDTFVITMPMTPSAEGAPNDKD